MAAPCADGIGVLGAMGSLVTWFVPPYPAPCSVAWLYSFMHHVVLFCCCAACQHGWYILARRFIAVRASSASVVLIAVFNVSGLLPQGAFAAWGVAATVILGRW